MALRFFALKLSIDTYKGNISDWLDRFSEAVVKGEVPFDYSREEQAFARTFDILASKLGAEAFVKHKNGRALGGLAPAYFDAVTMGLLPLIDRLTEIAPEKAKAILNDAVGHENENFRENVGASANAAPRLRKRIAEVMEVFNQKLPKQGRNGAVRKRA